MRCKPFSMRKRHRLLYRNRLVVTCALISMVILVGMARSTSAREAVLDQVVALVNNRPVLSSEINEYLSRILPKSGVLDDYSHAPQSREKVIQQLIDEELIQQEAERQNIQVTQEDFEKALEELKKRNNMNTSQFILALAKNGVTYQQFSKELKQEIRKMLIIRQEVMNRIVINDSLLQQVFEENQHKYVKSEQVRLKQIFEPLRPESSYEEKQAIRRLMEGILTLIKKDGDFELVVARYSSGPHALRVVDMGWLKFTDIAKPLAEAIRPLKKGEVSGLIESPIGLHIVKVEDTAKGAGPTLDEVKENVRLEIFDKEFQKRYREWLKGLRDAAHIEVRR